MTIFIRLLEDEKKDFNLLGACNSFRAAHKDPRIYQVVPDSFRRVPGAPFSYWVSEAVRNAFEYFPPFEGSSRIARVTNQTGDDNRYIRAWWEIQNNSTEPSYYWRNFAKGGAFSPFFYDVHLLVRWDEVRQTYHGFVGTEHRPLEKPACLEHFFRPGLTWPRRTNGLSFRAMPEGCIFSNKGPAAFVSDDDPASLLALLALLNSQAFGLLVSVQLARVELAQSFEVGLIQQTPIPNIAPDQRARLALLAKQAWSLMRTLDTVEETSHTFVLPRALRPRQGSYNPTTIEVELTEIKREIDDAAFTIYGFLEDDRWTPQRAGASICNETESDTDDDGDEAQVSKPVDQTLGLLSWVLGVAFGRFDLRLATGERKPPAEPAPFDPLPTKSPGMLPNGVEAFHSYAGILVDDPGHEHDLARLIEEVLTRVDAPVPSDVRRWLQREFFPFHLQRYSKSRRKAPIYWPLSTASAGYTLWLYYPDLTSQTLYTAVNEFVEPKLAHASQELTALRNKGSTRSRDDDKAMEALQTLEQELVELRDTLLQIAPTYRPNHDDGVQITAAPLWPLFLHKPWQKLLKETWGKLEKGDYDWSHLAMAYWPDRVREKCKTDKSLAIAHDLEELYEPPPESPAGPGRGGRKRRGTAP